MLTSDEKTEITKVIVITTPVIKVCFHLYEQMAELRNQLAAQTPNIIISLSFFLKFANK